MCRTGSFAAPRRGLGQRPTSLCHPELENGPRSAVICVPPQGSGYTAFTLTDGTARVPVIGWGTQQIGMGDVVEVRDAFRTRLSAGNEVPLDTVEAKFVRLMRAAAAARNTGQPAIGPRREDAIERDHRRGRSWPASPNSRGEIERLRSVLWRLTIYAAGGAAG